MMLTACNLADYRSKDWMDYRWQGDVLVSSETQLSVFTAAPTVENPGIGECERMVPTSSNLGYALILQHKAWSRQISQDPIP
mmetsp:Transcript_7385/g.11265  ORF Transcript_7385/g.11265 Transcript_7385/m.11265 type:complete len:82 (+) Transcript_7385:208-453(+)